jgi:beta-galactosidase
MINPKLPCIWYGADYNPDQWPEEVWQDDVRLMRKAGVNVVTLPVFSWVKLQPEEQKFTFDWLDRILDLLYENGVYACLATSTAAQPAWMSAKYPDVLPVSRDGRRRKHGWRQNYCPNSKNFRRLSQGLARKMAERYKKHPGLAIWHVSNEYGSPCFCETCAQAFREWLNDRYGSLEAVNKAWYTSFWSHAFTDWDEIQTPTDLGDTSVPAMRLDYDRFQSESILACYRGEADILRSITPDIPITTNLMGTYKPLDYFAWAKHLDVVSWDSYPQAFEAPWVPAMRHDLMRGLKDGQPFMLMEQTPDQTNWCERNTMKAPGVMRAQSYQAMMHGADTIMFFQWRKGQGGFEKFHGAFVDHSGSEEMRPFQELAALGAELKSLGDTLLGSTVPARVAILFDWECWWAQEYAAGPSQDLKYLEQVERWYAAVHAMNVPVELVNPSADLGRFDVVIAPTLYMVRPGVAANLESVAKRGGAVIGSLWTGIVNETDLTFLGGFPGPLRPLFGFWNQEIDPLQENVTVKAWLHAPEAAIDAETYSAPFECRVAVERLKLETAESVASYTETWHKGEPAITRNRFGEGEAWYAGTDLDAEARAYVLNAVFVPRGITAPIAAPAGVEVGRRVKDGKTFTFAINHGPTAVILNAPQGTELLSGDPVGGPRELASQGVWVIEER